MICAQDFVVKAGDEKAPGVHNIEKVEKMKRYTVMLLCGILSMVTAGSPLAATGAQTVLAQAETDETEHAQKEAPDAPDLPGLTWDHTLPLSYADQFSVDYYEGGYKLFTIEGDG